MPKQFSSREYPISSLWPIVACIGVITRYGRTLIGILLSFGLVGGIFWVTWTSVTRSIPTPRGVAHATFTPWSVLPVNLIAFGVLGLFALLFVFSIVKKFTISVLWRQNFSFSFDSEYVSTQQGVVSRAEVQVPYRTMQDVIFSQTVGDRLFGIGSVIIQNAATGGTVLIPGQPIEKGHELADELRKRIAATHPSGVGL